MIIISIVIRWYYYVYNGNNKIHMLIKYYKISILLVRKINGDLWANNLLTRNLDNLKSCITGRHLLWL